MRHSLKYWIALTGIIFLFLMIRPPYMNAQKAKSVVKVLEAATKHLPVKPVISSPKFRPYVPGSRYSRFRSNNNGSLLGKNTQVNKLPQAKTAQNANKRNNHDKLPELIARNIKPLSDTKPWCIDHECLEPVLDALVLINNSSISILGTWHVIGWQDEVLQLKEKGIVYAKKRNDEYIMIIPDASSSYISGTHVIISHDENSDFKIYDNKHLVAIQVLLDNCKRTMLLEHIAEDFIPPYRFGNDIVGIQTCEYQIFAKPEQRNQNHSDATFATPLQNKDSEAKSNASGLLSPEDDKRWSELGKEIEELGFRLGLEKMENLLFPQGMQIDVDIEEDTIGFIIYSYEYRLDAA